MAIGVDKVIVELEARLGRYEANIRNAERRFGHSMRNIQGAATRTEARVSSAFRSMAAAAGFTIGTAGVLLAARQFLQYADAAKNLEAQLRLATRASGSFAQAQEDVRRIAAATRSGLEETATLYAVFQRNARELGITQEQAARATQTVSQTFLISGASAAEAAGGLRQFLQGIQSGTLRGEELNSVLENAPRLARLLADSLGVTIGELRRMGQEGELTGQRLIAALTERRFTDQIDEEFRQLPVTFDQAMTLVNNAAIETFGAFDRGGQFSTAIANFVTQGTGGMEEIAAAAEQAGIDIRAAFDGLGDAFVPLWQGAVEAFGGINQQIFNTRAILADLLGAIDTVANLYNRVGNAVDNFGSNVLEPAIWSGPRGGIMGGRRLFAPGTRGSSSLRDRFLRGYDASQAQGQQNAQARRMGPIDQSGRSLMSDQVRRWASDPRRYDFFGREISPPRAAPASATGRGRKRRGEDPEAVARREAAEEQRFQNELAQLNEDLLAARQAMVTAADAIAAYEIQQIEAARDRQNAAYQAQVEQTRGDRALAQRRADQLVEANNAVAAERVNAVNLREQDRIARERVDSAQAGLDNEIEMEQAFGALARTNEERRASSLRLLDLEQQQERLALEAVIASRESTENQRNIARARMEILDTLYQARRRGAIESTMSERQRYLRDLSDVGETMNEQIDRVAIDGFERLNDELADAVTGFLNLGGVAGRVLNQIISDLLRIAIQQQIIRPLANALFGGGGFGSLFGGGSKALSALPAIGTGLKGFASGGSFMFGGRPGIDQNLLSLNGQPIAKVSRGETGIIVPQGGSPGGVGGRARMGAGGGNSINVTINAQDAVLTHAVRVWVAEGIQIATQAGAARGAMATERSLARRGRQALP